MGISLMKERERQRERERRESVELGARGATGRNCGERVERERDVRIAET